MTTTTTFSKKQDGEVYIKQVTTAVDIQGKTVTLKNEEMKYDHAKLIPYLQNKLAELQAEIAELKTEETHLINRISDIETARDSITPQSL